MKDRMKNQMKKWVLLMALMVMPAGCVPHAPSTISTFFFSSKQSNFSCVDVLK